uniref:Uncharacterized protein n=1 Tax=Cacopsylla melanoneura TaxID=428564 RepID=A0A8D8TEJ2_9HEMI
MLEFLNRGHCHHRFTLHIKIRVLGMSSLQDILQHKVSPISQLQVLEMAKSLALHKTNPLCQTVLHFIQTDPLAKNGHNLLLSVIRIQIRIQFFHLILTSHIRIT